VCVCVCVCVCVHACKHACVCVCACACRGMPLFNYHSAKRLPQFVPQCLEPSTNWQTTITTTFIKEAARLSERQSQLQCTSFHCMLPFAATRCSAHCADHQAHSNSLTRQSPVQCLIQTTLMRDCPSLNTILTFWWTVSFKFPCK